MTDLEPRTSRRLRLLTASAVVLVASFLVGASASDAGAWRNYPSAGFWWCPLPEGEPPLVRQCLRFTEIPYVDTYGVVQDIEVYAVREELIPHGSPGQYRANATPLADVSVTIRFATEGMGGTDSGVVCELVTGADGIGTCPATPVGDVTGLWELQRKQISASASGLDGRYGTPDDVYIQVVEDDRPFVRADEIYDDVDQLLFGPGHVDP